MPLSSRDERRALELFERLLALPASEHDAFIEEHAGDTPEIEDRLKALLVADGSGGDVLRTGGAHNDFMDDPMPERIGAYRVVRLIGAGGMGSVYLAERDANDFEHTAAVKLIRTGMFSPDLIDRFFRERQLLARLNHVNIARLFDGGETPSGAPYMVMEYVDGAPILDWLREKNASLKSRLDVFRQACTAVSHAHKNLIIHRDITPSNVLVTGEGIVKLVDFGLSRPHSKETEKVKAQSASLSFTPGYSAPERTAGSEGNTLSDVYSLGRLFSDIVPTGIRTPELQSMIDRASAAQPEDRYQSVDGLLDDLERFEEKRPVSSHQGGAFYPFRKLVERRRTAMAAAGLALTGLVAALITTTVLYNRAETERQAADARFEDVRSLAGFVIFDLYDELEKTPGNTRSIAMLAEEAQSYLDSLSEDRRASREVTLESIRGYQRLADILGNPDMANLGDRATSGEMLSSALTRAEDMLERFPEDPDVLRAFGEVAFASSTHAYVSDDDNERAIEHAESAVAAYEKLVQREDATFDDQRQRVRAYLMTAVPLPWLGRADEGIDRLEFAIGEAKRLAEAYPDRSEGKLLLGSLNIEMARARVRASDTNEVDSGSLPYWNEAIRLREESFAENPEDMRPYRSLVTIYYSRGAQHRSLGDFDAAYNDAVRSREIAAELLAKDPGDAWLQRMSAGIEEEIARTLSYAGRHEEAVAQARLVRPGAREQYEAQPDNRGTKREWGYTQVLLADVFIRAGELQEGCPLTQSARATWDALSANQPLAPHDLENSIALLETLEETCRQSSRPN